MNLLILPKNSINSDDKEIYRIYTYWFRDFVACGQSLEKKDFLIYFNRCTLFCYLQKNMYTKYVI